MTENQDAQKTQEATQLLSRDRSLLTVTQMSKKHSAFSESSLRSIIFYSDTNGFKRSIKRVGRKVLIDEDVFFECVDEQNDQNKK